MKFFNLNNFLQICMIFGVEKNVFPYLKKRGKKNRFKLLRLIIKWYHYKVYYVTANENFRLSIMINGVDFIFTMTASKF